MFSNLDLAFMQEAIELAKEAKLNGEVPVGAVITLDNKIINALKIPIGEKRDGTQSYFVFPYYFYDYQIKVNLDINPVHRLTYSRFYGDDVLNFSFGDSYDQVLNDGGTVNQESNFNIEWPWGNHTNGLTWRWIVSPTTIAKTFISNSRYRFNFEFGYNDTYTYNYSTGLNPTN